MKYWEISRIKFKKSPHINQSFKIKIYQCIGAAECGFVSEGCSNRHSSFFEAQQSSEVNKKIKSVFVRGKFYGAALRFGLRSPNIKYSSADS
jgi:hypothetical protein